MFISPTEGLLPLPSIETTPSPYSYRPIPLLDILSRYDILQIDKFRLVNDIYI